MVLCGGRTAGTGGGSTDPCVVVSFVILFIRLVTVYKEWLNEIGTYLAFSFLWLIGYHQRPYTRQTCQT